jgi:hypothetical protein
MTWFNDKDTNIQAYTAAYLYRMSSEKAQMADDKSSKRSGR